MPKRLLLAVVGLYAVACASASPRPTATSAVSRAAGAEFASMLRSRTEHDDAVEFREELEAVYEQIVTRGTLLDPKINKIEVAKIPEVDIEAAHSIPIPEHRTINSAVRLFSVDMKDKIQDSLSRSGRYRHLIDSALEEYGLPKGLAYLPVIESAYVPTLTSRAGAHGIWQFMPDTAREYGLRVDWWVDERADPERSTRAAAAYLRNLYDRFQDWPLTLAAYNCGPGRVRRTLDESGASSFWELLDQGLLPRETRGYVPTFFATLLIASDPQSYGFELGRPIAAEHREVDLRGPVSLTWIAEATGTDEGTIRALNPGLKRGVVPPGRSWVRVPSHAAPVLISRARTLSSEDDYLKYCSFRVRRGDTLRSIARAIGSTPDALMAMNGLRSAGEIRAGDSLYLPVRARELGALLAHGRDREAFYAVRKGDTLYSIARRNGITVSDLRDLNELRGDAKLKIGQKLRVSATRTAAAGGM